MANLTLDFIGKDSVHLKNTYDIPDDVANVLKEMIADKKPSDNVFSAGSKDVSSFLKGCLDFMSPKLFRTAWGTKLLIEELQKNPCSEGMTDFQKKAIYNNAALEVSKKLNHQRGVAKTYKDQTKKLDDKLKQAKEKNKETVEKSKQQLEKIKADIAKVKSKYKGADRKERLQKLEERKEKISKRLERSSDRIEKTKLDIDFKKNTKNIAIGTAKSSYSDPKCAFSWCKDNNVDISLVYSKSLQEKYKWAEDVSPDYWKKFPNV